MKILILILLLVLPVVAACAPQPEETSGAVESDVSGLVGRWDVTVQQADGGSYPSWFQINRTGEALSGRFVGRFGSARPIAEITFHENSLHFSLPVQYEQHATDLVFDGRLEGGELQGTTNGPDGEELRWSAVRAPDLPAPETVQWGEPIELFNGTDLSGWRARFPDAENHWQARDGVLVNSASGTDLITEQSFEDFRLQLEFQYPEGSNSGVYLRGMYEVQVQDDHGKPADSLHLGGVYGFITPSKNAAKPAGEWQSFDITLLGRQVTIVVNGEIVIDKVEIPGITGGALSSREDGRGPIMLQGDHGPVNYRNIRLTPAN